MKWKKIEIRLKPDFAVIIVLKGKKAIKTSIWADFLAENMLKKKKEIAQTKMLIKAILCDQQQTIKTHKIC